MRIVLLSYGSDNSGDPVDPGAQAQFARVGSHTSFGSMLSASDRESRRKQSLFNQSPFGDLADPSGSRARYGSALFSPDPVDRERSLSTISKQV